MKSERKGTGIGRIEQLKKEQRKIRTIGIVCMVLGFALDCLFLVLNLTIAVPFAACVFFVGIILTARSYSHSKYAVLKKMSGQPVPAADSYAPPPKDALDLLMTSQLAALYLDHSSGQDAGKYRERYILRLEGLGINELEAARLFDFESGIIRKFNKHYLLSPEFTQSWVFGLKHRFFQDYPQEKPDILKERFLTMSELCKIIDEAEWHYWNSHERKIPDDVWKEICEWRLKQAGGDFAIEYFDMIAKAAGVTERSVGLLAGEQGRHLSLYKWK